MNQIIEDFLKFLVITCLVGFFYWTGQALFICATLGYYSPPDKSPYGRGESTSTRLRGLILQLLSVTTGGIFWLLTFPLLYDLVHPF